MEITSPDFKNGEALPTDTGYRSDNRRPNLNITGVPDKAESLAVIVSDPDAPNGDFTHWLAWNIPPHIPELSSYDLPNGTIEGTNDFGAQAWGGPAPPSGMHHYHFKVFALNKPLELTPEATKGRLLSAIQENILDQSEIIGTFSADQPLIF